MIHKKPDWYHGPDDPHGTLKPVYKEGRRTGLWCCVDCGATGEIDALSNDSGCTKVHEPCPYCGCSPVCASDCRGIAEILGDPKVYVAGCHGVEHKNGN